MVSSPFSENHVNVCDAEVEMKSMIGDVPWCTGHRYEKFRLVSLNDSYVGLSSTALNLHKNKMELQNFTKRGICLI
jgi:hypothetical protein